MRPSLLPLTPKAIVPPVGLLQGSGEVSQKIGNELVSIPRQII